MRNHGADSPKIFRRSFEGIETEICLPVLLVKPVAIETLVTENRTDITSELNLTAETAGSGRYQDENQEEGWGRLHGECHGDGDQEFWLVALYSNFCMIRP